MTGVTADGPPAWFGYTVRVRSEDGRVARAALDGQATVDLDDALRRELGALALASGRPQAELVREALEVFVVQRERRVITLGASAVVALQDRRNRHHRSAVGALASRSVVPVLPAAILAELDRALRLGCPSKRSEAGIEARSEAGSETGIDAVLGSLIDGSLFLDCGDVDPPRIRQLMRRYDRLDLSFADAALVACGERHGGAIMAFDRPHLQAVEADGTITLVP